MGLSSAERHELYRPDGHASSARRVGEIVALTNEAMADSE
jgi:hypothetical protein